MSQEMKRLRAETDAGCVWDGVQLLTVSARAALAAERAYGDAELAKRAAEIARMHAALEQVRLEMINAVCQHGEGVECVVGDSFESCRRCRVLELARAALREEAPDA